MSTPLPEDFRRVLGLDGEPTIADGLTHAEERLQQVMEQLQKLPENHPSQVKLRRDRETLEPIVQELRDTVFGVKVDELCDAAEEALAERPTKKAKARELLKQARREGRALSVDSVYLRRVERLEGGLEERPFPTSTPRSDAPRRSGTSSGKDLSLDATLLPKSHTPGHPLAGPSSSGDATLATGTPARPPALSDSKPTPPSRGSTPTNLTPPSPGTGGDPSSIPTGLVAGLKVGEGRFTLIRELGRGGMGVVWLAADGLLKREVALKLLPPEVATDDLALDDLRRETRDSQRLTHQNIMRIHDFYEKPGEPAFISMEYVDGPNLRSLLGKQPQRVFAWNFLLPLMRQLCDALEYAHEERVIHRDLKPSNLMLDSKGRLKLADFGIAATMSDSMSRVSQMHDKNTSGTLPYMSPQQMRGASPSPSDDIYSLGATLYELLTSRTPFFRGDIQDQVRNEAPTTIEQRLKEFRINNQIPEHVSTLIMSCLSKDPKERPESALWLKKQLENPQPAPPPRKEAQPEVLTPPAGKGKKPVVAPKENIAAPTARETRPAKPPVEPPSGPGGFTRQKKILAVMGVVVAIAAIAGVVVMFQPKRTGPSPGPDHKPVPPPLVQSDITFTVRPANAEVSSNGTVVAAGSHLKGTPGYRFKLRAQLDGYVPEEKPVTFPAANQTSEEKFDLKPNPVKEIPSEIAFIVQPAAAELRSNDVPISNTSRLTGKPGHQFQLSAHLDNYVTETKSVIFPAGGKSETVRFDLQPKLAKLMVQFPGPVTSVVFSNSEQVIQTNSLRDGVYLKPGKDFQMVLTSHDYQTFTTNISAMTPGEIATLPVGELALKTASLDVTADPGTTLTLYVPGGKPEVYHFREAGQVIKKLRARVQFEAVAERVGYLSKTNTISLEPGETKQVDFSQMQGSSGSLKVRATPPGFRLTVTWSGGTKDSTDGQVSDLPLGKDLLVTVSAVNYISVSTNINLKAGHPLEWNLGQLEVVRGNLILKYEPADAAVTYSIDNHAVIDGSGSPKQISDLPLGHLIGVTLSKKGYNDKSQSIRLQHSGDQLDLGQMVLKTISVVVNGPSENAGAEVSVDGRPLGIKSGGTIRNLLYGKTYTIKLHKDGYTDVSKTIPLNSDATEQTVYMDGMTAIPKPPPSLADEVFAAISKNIADVNQAKPLAKSSQKQWRDFVSKEYEGKYRNNAEVWPRIRDSVRTLRDLIDTPTPRRPGDITPP